MSSERIGAKKGNGCRYNVVDFKGMEREI